MTRNTEKHAFMEHSLSVLKSKQTEGTENQTELYECIPSDHPFFSQYNRLKTENYFKKQLDPISLDKFGKEMLDNVCQKEFEKYALYRMKCTANENKMQFYSYH